MPLCPLLSDELQWTDYIGPRVEANSSRWKLKYIQRTSTYLHNEMNVREGHADYRCRICNDIGHNRKIYPNRQRMYNNLLGHVMIYYDMF